MHDAIQQCHTRLNGTRKDCWILDADVSAAFDKINHEFVLRKLGNTPGKHLIKEWLKAGYVEDEIFNATVSGVPQGGVISPVLANIALDGMECLVQSLGKFGFVRYADDFVVTAKTREALDELKPAIIDFLRERGLTLNQEKTRIVHINEGFNFLGFTIRRLGSKCIVKPQKDKTLAFLQSIRDWLKSNPHVEPEIVIGQLNPRKQVGASSTGMLTANVSSIMSIMRSSKQFGDGACFDIPRKVRVGLLANTLDDPRLTAYWEQRKTRSTRAATKSGAKQLIEMKA